MSKEDATVAYHVGAAETEAAIRAKLIELGWTPPRDDGATEGAYATEDMIRAHNEGLEKGRQLFRGLAVALTEALSRLVAKHGNNDDGADVDWTELAEARAVLDLAKGVLQ